MIVYCNDVMLANHVRIANTFIRRLIGLMGRKCITEGEGLLLTSCASIHCFFMKFTIDVIYLSKDMNVLWVETVDPWRIGSFVKGAKHILELAPGTAAGFVKPGDRFTVMDINIIG